jgi:predicted RND superfamily exporter protein
MRTTYARTGTAVLASGVTAIAGFAALAATDIRMLRDFGLVTVADLAVALLGVMLVLPATLVWVEGRRVEGRRVERRAGRAAG